MIRRTLEEMKNDYNNKLQQFFQNLRIEYITQKTIKLSNGKILCDNDRKKFFRFLSSNIIHLFDLKYSINDIDVAKYKIMYKEYKSLIGKYTGKMAYDKHGNEHLRNWIKKNGSWNKGKASTSIPWNKGRTKDISSSLAKMSRDRIGKGNPMYGKRHTKEYKNKSSIRMKHKIETGTFIPNTNNRLTYFNINFNNIKYRSTWEVLYAVLNPYDEYEALKIKYKHNSKNHVYIVDFINHIDKIVTEIKPVNVMKQAKNLDKQQYLMTWAIDNGYTYQWISDCDIMQMRDSCDLTIFDDDIKRKLSKVRCSK